jgi:DNA-binding GntR family transcriptional regulator
MAAPKNNEVPKDNENPNYGAMKRQPYLSLTDIAYNVLVEAIINQDFKPGAPISIDSFAKQITMSNTPVREALMRAHGERLVTQKTNHGFVVANILTSEELGELFEVRHLIEVHAVSEGEITQEAVAAITRMIDGMSATGDGEVYDDFRDFMSLDRQFHRALVAMAGNEVLVRAWENLHVHLHLSRLYTSVGRFDRNDSKMEHNMILDALRKQDRKLAANLLSQHIKRVEKRMQSYLSK